MPLWTVVLLGAVLNVGGFILGWAAGDGISRLSRPLGVGLSFLAAWRGYQVGIAATRPAATFTPLEKSLALAAAVSLGGFIAGCIARLARGKPLAPGEIADLMSRPVLEMDQRQITQLFDIAREQYEAFATAYLADQLSLPQEEAERACRDPSMGRAEKQLTKVVEWCRGGQGPGLTATALDQLGALYLRQGRNDAARRCIEEAQEIFSTLPSADRDLTVAASSCLIRVGALRLRSSDIDGAEEAFSEAVLLATRCGQRANKAYARECLNRCRDARGGT